MAKSPSVVSSWGAKRVESHLTTIQRRTGERAALHHAG
jgi:hypothetical protein